MNKRHLSEEELQQLALDPQHADPTWAAHIHNCPECSAAIANYRVIFSSLKTMEKPVFNFDVEKIVMAQLPAAKPSRQGAPWYSILMAMAAGIVFAIPLLVMNRFLIQLLKGIPVIILDIIIITALGIVIFQCGEILASYRKKMRLLNFY